VADSENQPAFGQVTGWHIGAESVYVTLDVDLGIVRAKIHLTSRQARPTSR